MKKVLIIVVCLLVMMTGFVYAGDVRVSIMTGKQDAFIIGKIDDSKDGKFIIHVEKLLIGEISGDTVNVKEFEYFAGKKPAKGDFCVLPMNKKEDGSYEVVYMAFKADSADYKTLKLEDFGSTGLNYSIQRFINNGKFAEVDKKFKDRGVTRQEVSPNRQINDPSLPQKGFAMSNVNWGIIGAVAAFAILLVFLLIRAKKQK